MSKVICVTNRNLCLEDFLERIEKIASAGVEAIVLREKDLSEKEYEILAGQVLDICKKHQVQCILHSYVRVAKKMETNAIHLPMHRLRELSVEDFQSFEVIGASCHSVEEAIEAEQLGCNYIVAGHIFETDCKKGLEPRGKRFLRNICDSVEIPVFGIGGISPDKYETIQTAGAAGACVMSSLMTCENPKDYIKQFGE
ncbi:MAG: thiamine phosphate synthase [Eubacterium sp.]|nr:thiamine phosphate synthase [Eubacterium sp.]